MVLGGEIALARDGKAQVFRAGDHLRGSGWVHALGPSRPWRR